MVNAEKKINVQISIAALTSMCQAVIEGWEPGVFDEFGITIVIIHRSQVEQFKNNPKLYLFLKKVLGKDDNIIKTINSVLLFQCEKTLESTVIPIDNHNIDKLIQDLHEIILAIKNRNIA